LPPKIPQDKLPKKIKLPNSTYVAFPAFDRGKPIQGGGFLLMPEKMPEGKTKVPVVIIEHGSGGVVPEHEYVYARELARIGVAAFVVDSFTPRGIAATIDNQRAIAINDVLTDVFGALNALRQNPQIDTTRAGILGNSKGGIAAMMAAMNTKRKELHIKDDLRFRAHYALYPGCVLHYYDNTTTGAPITLFLGEKDNYTSAETCVTLANELKAKGANIQTIIYKDTGHGWDIPGVARSYPKAEVFKDCRFDQQADGSWNEKKSGVTHIPAMIGPLYEKALQGCVSYGVTNAENLASRIKTMDDLKALVRKQLIE
jgi:dienelactone hydrolase